MPRQLSYDILNVFCLSSDQPFTGNPLAVVYDSDGLSTAQLQTIAAREASVVSF